MHELSIAISMIEQIVEESDNRGGLEVEAVHLKLGVFSGVDKDALLFAYELACEGTPLQGSRLLIETIPLVIYCPAARRSERRSLYISSVVRIAWFRRRRSLPAARSKLRRSRLRHEHAHGRSESEGAQAE